MKPWRAAQDSSSEDRSLGIRVGISSSGTLSEKQRGCGAGTLDMRLSRDKVLQDSSSRDDWFYRRKKEFPGGTLAPRRSLVPVG